MVSESDFITIPYTPDMTQAGIRYACQTFSYADERIGDDHISRLRCTVASKAVQLGFKRYLDKSKIPHDMLGSTPFSDPDNYDIALGGRRCKIENCLITNKKQIHAIHKEPHCLLNAQAIIAMDQISGDDLIDDDILIFAFLAALITPNRRILEKAFSAGQPIFLINVLPNDWTNPNQWRSLGKLVVESNLKITIRLELGGRNLHHEFQMENLILDPNKQMEVKQNFFTLNYLLTPNFPDETIGISSSVLYETYLVKPIAWKNIWVYGMEITVAGYITCGEFRRNASQLPYSLPGFQSASVQEKNISIPIQDLHPINDLFEHAIAWSQM